jgi:site-specific recombinase XerD
MARKKIPEVTEEFWENVVHEDNKELIEAFLEQENLSDDTLKQYRSALRIFAKWIYDNHFSKKKGEEKLITELLPRDALSYQNWLVKQGLGASSIRFKRSAVSSLCGYIEVYWSDKYPNFRNIYSKSIKNVAKTKTEKDPLTKDELETIARELEEREEWQKLAYLWYTYATGCRREESRQLRTEVATYELAVDKKGNVKDFYWTHTIRAKGAGKTGKPRKFKFNQKAMDAIKKWLDYRATQVDEDDCEFVFVSKNKGEYRQLSANTFNRWCEYFSTFIGGKKVHPHLFRTSRATIAKEDGVDIKKIQSLLGHESSQTTEIYIVSDDSDDSDGLF